MPLSWSDLPADVLAALRQGAVIPAHPLALTGARKFDARRQKALTRYYIGLDVADKAGVLAAVAQTFAAHDVSIETLRQDGRGDEAALLVVTHKASESALAAVVENLRALDVVRAVASVMRVEGD